MIEALTIKAACNGILRTTFPNMKVYGPDTTGALERPSFYTEIIPYVLEYQTINLVRQRIGFKISLMEEVTNEEFELEVLSKIRKAFGLKLAVTVEDPEDDTKTITRQLTISNLEFEYTGVKNDVFQITIAIEWIDSIAVPDDHDLMEILHYREVLNRNN